MQQIRKIDFKRLWACINSNVNNNAWNESQYHPVPIIFWDEDSGMNRHEWIILRIQLVPPSKGGVCRFKVYRGFKKYDLAKYLQTNAYKNSPPRIYVSLLDCLTDCFCIEERKYRNLLNNSDLRFIARWALKYRRAFSPKTVEVQTHLDDMQAEIEEHFPSNGEPDEEPYFPPYRQAEQSY